MKKEKNEEEYSEWIEKEWSKQGGLIQPKVAAAILSVSITRIKQMRDEGKLKEFKDPRGKPMLSYGEVIRAKDNKLKDFKISYKLKIKNIQTEEITTQESNTTVHRIKTPKKEDIINEAMEEFKIHENYLDIEVYNIKIYEIIQE